MPDVGVLQLKISADASSASKSLKALQTRLSEINTLAQSNFNLGNVSTQIRNIVDSVKGDSNVSTAVKNLGTLLNAIAAFSKAKGFSLDESQVESLKSLQTIANGFKMGAAGVQLNQMRQAISEPWNIENAQSAAAAMEAMATGADRLAESGAEAKISSIAKALKEYSTSISELKTSLGEGFSIPTAVTTGQGQGFVSLGLASTQGMREGITEGTGEVVSAAKELADAAKEATKTELDIHSPSRVYHEIGLQTAAGFENGLREGLSNINVYGPLEALKNRFMYAGEEISEKVSGSLSSLRAYKEATIETGRRIDPNSFGIPVATKNIEAATQSLDGFAQSSRVIKEVETTVRDIGTAEADVAEKIRSANRATEEDIRLRKEELELANQRRLESNYAAYRELYMSKEDEWQKQVPEMYGFTPKAIEEGETYAEAMRITMQEINEYVDQYIDKMNTPSGPLLRDSIDEAMGIGRAFKDAKDSASILQNAPDIREKAIEVQTSVNNMANSMSKSQTATRVLTENMKDLDGELKQKKSDMSSVGHEAKSLASRFSDLMFGAQGLGGSFKRMFPTISGLLGRFRQLVKYRMLRAVIKQISEGFKEGMENYYYYSKAIGGDFAPAMDSAASALLQMKNSIGAAMAPLLQSLIPILQTVVNAFISLINYANQFIALLRGQASWSQAVPATTSAFGDVTNAANGAGAAIKDLLADWDELNIIQSENSKSGGGGGTAAMEDYLNMFEETSEFDNKVKGIVNFIKDNLGDILSIAKAIGAAILAWKISKAFGGLFEKFGLLAGAAATIYIGVKLTDMFGKEYAKTGEPGWFIADALTGAVGAGIAGKIASKLFGGATAGFVVAGFTLALEGAVNIKNAVTAMDQRKEGEAWALDALGSLEAGIGVALATFKFIGPWSLALGATIAVGTFLLSIPIMMEIKRQAEYRDMAIAAFSETGENGIDPEMYIKALQTRLNELTVGARLTIDAFAGFDEHGENFSKNMEALANLNTLLTSGDKLTTEQATQFKDAWHIVFESMEELSKISFDTIYAGLSNVVATGSNELKKQAEELRKQTLEIQGIVGGTQARIKKEMEMLVNTITSPTTDKEELEKAIERYDYLYKVMADAEDSGIKDIKKRFAGGEGFDFSKEEKPVQAAIDFIQRIASEDLTPALENVKAAYEAGVESIEEVKKNLGLALAVGDIDQPTYDKFMDVLLGDEAVLKQQMDDRIKEINDLRNDAYRQLMTQALAGYNDIKDNEDLANAYINNVLNPILDALDASGFDTTAYRSALKPVDITSLIEVDVSTSERDEIYKQIIDEFGLDEKYTIPMMLGYEVDMQMAKTGSNLIAGDSDLAADIINSILDIDGINYGDAIEAISQQMGWDINDILSHIDLSKFDKEGLEILLNTIHTMKEELEFTNPISDMDESDVAEKTRSIAQAYEDMADRIDKALKRANVDDDSFFGKAHSLVMQKISSAFGTVQDAMNVVMPSDITVHEERNSEQEASNTAEGVRRGNTDLVTGQNQANRYMSQMVQYLAIIAQKSGGSVGLAQSALGGMVSAAMEAFGNITG